MSYFRFLRTMAWLSLLYASIWIKIILKFEISLLSTEKQKKQLYINQYCVFITPPQGGLRVAPMNTQPNSHGQKPPYKWNTTIWDYILTHTHIAINESYRHTHVQNLPMKTSPSSQTCYVQLVWITFWFACNWLTHSQLFDVVVNTFLYYTKVEMFFTNAE